MKTRSKFLAFLVIITANLLSCTREESPLFPDNENGPGIIPASYLASLKGTYVSLRTPIEAVAGFDIADSGGGTIIKYGVCWSTAKYPTTADRHIKKTGAFSKDEKYLIGGLTTSTTYYLRAFASNSIGRAYGEQVSFTTPGFSPDSVSFGSVTDLDGNTYRTIQVGPQEWMAENLKTTKYNNGGQIYYCTNGGPAGFTEWFDLDFGAYCWYDNDPEANRDLGAIYNFHAVGTGKLCPSGWRVPSYSEWVSLICFLGGTVDSFSEQTDNAPVYWNNLERNIELSGFNPDPGGCLDGFGFINKDYPAARFWWTSDLYDNFDYPLSAYIVSFNLISLEPASYGYNVRCVKDK